MVRYNIRINTGDNNVTTKYYFIHKDWKHLTTEEQDAAFNKAVEELERIYKNYGRFATNVGVERLFRSFGFERTVP